MTVNPVHATTAGAGSRDRPLRLAVRLDAASGAMGVLLAAGDALLDDLLGIPAAVLPPVGGFVELQVSGLRRTRTAAAWAGPGGPARPRSRPRRPGR
jgi:hypothetical protein